MKWYFILLVFFAAYILLGRVNEQQESFCRTVAESTDSVVVAFCEGVAK